MRWLIVFAVLLIALGAACSSGDDATSTPTGSLAAQQTGNPCGGGFTSICGDTPPAEASNTSAPIVVSHPKGTLVFEGVDVDGATLGKADAPVSAELWVNFRCPHCAEFVYDALPQIVDTYVKTGEIKLTIRNAALGSTGALAAHEAALCAGDQGKFFNAFDALFATFSESDADFTVDRIVARMDGSGVDSAALRDCLLSNKYLDLVQSDLRTLDAAGGPNLPFFAVGSQSVQAPESFAAVKTILDAAIAQSH